MNEVDATLSDMASALSQLARIARDNAKRPALIEQARGENATWEQIAEAMQMSRAGVIKLHNSAKSEGNHGTE